jgi:uncharacterized protein
MNITYTLQDLEFEWDAEKASSNLEKHGIPFEEAAEVFLDPFYQLGDATRSDESRDYVIGQSASYRTLLVVFVERNPRIRIISAREATRQERLEYEQGW